MSISVVIPAYNAERFIAQTLESVLAQTLPPDEVLVIDDGSTDSTADVAERFGAPVRVIRRANARQSATRNFGVQEAKSEWIAFIDADDRWEPDKLARQAEELARHPEADLCYTARVQLFDDGVTTRLGRVIPVPAGEDVRTGLFRNTTFLPSSVMVRRSAFLASGGFDTSMNYVEDWDLWMRMFHSGMKFAAVQEPLVQHRLHAGSMSHQAMASLAAEKAMFRRHVLPHLPPSTRWFAHQKSQSGQESSAAFVLREVGDRRSLSMMARSILRYPLNDPHRYKVFAHMVYTRFRQSLSK
jgi:glycosyltransferase involved in cell wall biosynthesis